MDYHFYNSPSETTKPIRIKKVLLTFFPLIVAAGLLPVFLGLIRNPVTIRQNAQADQKDLTVWIEPANVTATKGTAVKFIVKGLYEGDQKLLPGVIVPVRIDGSLASIENATVQYIQPFSGQVDLGTIIVTPQKTGTIVVSIDPKEVKSPTAQNQPNVFVSSASIVVR